MVVRKWGDELTGPVGIRYGKQVVKNTVDDKEYVVGLLAQIPATGGGKQEAWAGGTPTLGPDRQCPADIHRAILDFQEFWKAQGVFQYKPDGVCDPRGKTIKQMQGIVAGLIVVEDPWKVIPPEGQADATACWAACYSWWLRATPGQIPRSQQEIFSLGASRKGTVLADGTVDLQGCMLFLQAQQPGLFAKNMTPDEVKPALTLSLLPVKPIMIGFRAGPMGGHMNVIHSYNRSTDELSIMEPWFPDPAADSRYQLIGDGVSQNFFNKKDGSLFKFTGKHVKRPLSHYTSKPFNGRLLIFPDPGRMPIPLP